MFHFPFYKQTDSKDCGPTCLIIGFPQKTVMNLIIIIFQNAITTLILINGNDICLNIY